MYYLQMKMLNFTYSYNMKLDFIGLGGVSLFLLSCLFVFSVAANMAS